MKLEQQVCSLDLAKRLKELGVRQESLFYWRLGYHTSEKFDKGVSLGKEGIISDKYELTYDPKPRYTTANVKWNQRDLAILEESEVAAFTVAELGEMLPTARGFSYLVTVKSRVSKTKHFWKCFYFHAEEGGEIDAVMADTEADARAKMLIYLLENKLLQA